MRVQYMFYKLCISNLCIIGEWIFLVYRLVYKICNIYIVYNYIKYHTKNYVKYKNYKIRKTIIL